MSDIRIIIIRTLGGKTITIIANENSTIKELKETYAENTR
jgi:translation initiation factor 1 (eIF-1/SUI1)